jgi:hypothetical protein
MTDIGSSDLGASVSPWLPEFFTEAVENCGKKKIEWRYTPMFTASLRFDQSLCEIPMSSSTIAGGRSSRVLQYFAEPSEMRYAGFL